MLEQIDRLLDEHTDSEIASILNERGIMSGCGKPFHARRVQKTRRAYRLKTRYTRLHDKGWLNLGEVSKKLGICAATVKKRRAQGMLSVNCIKLNDMDQYMYEDPDARTAARFGQVSACSQEV